MYERFTDRARKVMQLANQEAQRFNHEYVGTEHILLGLVKEGSGTAAIVLKNLDIDLGKTRKEIEKIVNPGPYMVTMGKLPQTPRAKKVIEFSIEEARLLNHNYVGTEHLLLGLLREDVGVAAQVLMNLGLNLKDVREELLNVLGGNPMFSGSSGEKASGQRKVKTPVLDGLGTDLTALARDGQLDPCIGRSNEIDRLLLVLASCGDANPLLVGPHGVGKRAIIRGLARLAASENSPRAISGPRIIHVSVRGAVFTAKDDSNKLLRCARNMVDEIRRAGDILLFVPDLFAYGHDSRLFKAALDANEIQYIATTTTETYRRAVVNDDLLGRNLQPVFVEPPTMEEVAAILNAHRDRFEPHHRVRIADDALAAAAELSERHLTEGCQPTRALRLLDQAAALFRLHHAPPPPDTSELDARIENLNAAKELAVAEQDFEKAAHLRDQADRLAKEKQRLLASHSSEQLLPGVVDAAAVELAVTKLTGVQFRGSDAIREKPPS
jgi:ATP-dependent Clp protease ATP-binding subunit ClpC